MSNCVRCNEPFFRNDREDPITGALPANFVPNGSMTKPGEVYSYAGRKEVSITGMCEHCFDTITYTEN
jgi:hypothetical protein